MFLMQRKVKFGHRFEVRILKNLLVHTQILINFEVCFIIQLTLNNDSSSKKKIEQLVYFPPFLNYKKKKFWGILVIKN